MNATRSRSPASAWIVIGAGVAAALHVGKLSPALPALREALGVTLVQAGFLLSMVQMAGMLLGLAVGLGADGVGLRRSIVAGLSLLGVSSLLGGWAQGPGVLLALRACEGLGFLLVSMPAPSLLRHLVPPERLSTMLGFWGTYMPLGTASALLCGPTVIGWAGWSAWWWLLGALALLMAVWVAVGVPPDHPAAEAEATATETTETTATTASTSAAASGVVRAGAWPERLRLTLRSPGPWLVALCFAMYSGQWLAVIGFLPTIYAQAGVPAGASALLTALVAAVNMVGNVASGRLLARGVRAQVLLYAGFAVMGAGTLAAFFVWPLDPGGAGLPASLRFMAVLMFSMVGGVIPGTLFSLAVRLAPGPSTISTTVGWMQQWSALGQFAGPPLVAWVASLTGGWQWTWAVTVACASTGMLLATRIARQPGAPAMSSSGGRA